MGSPNINSSTRGKFFVIWSTIKGTLKLKAAFLFTSFSYFYICNLFLILFLDPFTQPSATTPVFCLFLCVIFIYASMYIYQSDEMIAINIFQLYALFVLKRMLSGSRPLRKLMNDRWQFNRLHLPISLRPRSHRSVFNRKRSKTYPYLLVFTLFRYENGEFRIRSWIRILLNRVSIEYAPFSVWTPKAETFEYANNSNCIKAFWNSASEIWKKRLQNGCRRLNDDMSGFLALI